MTCRRLTSIALVAFVWVDVACIDQTKGSPEMAVEIGRQATIFLTAQKVYCWLAHRQEAWYVKWQEDMVEQLKSSSEGDSLQQKHFVAFELLGDSLAELFADPWFTSLWTLQEAFLRKDMILLSQNGSVVHWSKSWPDPSETNSNARKLLNSDEMSSALTQSMVTTGLDLNAQITRQVAELVAKTRQELNLKQIPSRPECFSLTQIQAIVRRLMQVIIDRTDLLHNSCGKRLLELFRKSGIAALCEDHPITLLTAARARTPKRPEDKVYGIMQVFGLKLGYSKPGCADQKFSLEDLEEQLGEAIMTHHVLPSQYFLHREPAEPYKAWRMSQYSEPVPFRLVSIKGLAYSSEIVSHCKLTAAMYEGHKVACYEGKALLITGMIEAWEPLCHDDSDAPRPVMHLGVMLDEVPELEISHQIDHPDGPSESLKQLHLLKEKKEQTLILYLGSRQLQNNGDPNVYNIGLILMPVSFNIYSQMRGIQYYRRIGLCIWGGNWDQEVRFSGEISVARLRTYDWVTQRGFFG